MAEVTYESDDWSVTFSATTYLTDYGVDRSPEWTEIDDVEVIALSFMGCDMPVDNLPTNLLVELIDIAYTRVDWDA